MSLASMNLYPVEISKHSKRIELSVSKGLPPCNTPCLFRTPDRANIGARVAGAESIIKSPFERVESGSTLSQESRP